jgi:hypothetical protein
MSNIKNLNQAGRPFAARRSVGDRRLNMVEVLEFVFKDAWNFIATLILIAWLGIWIGIARAGIRIK